MRAVLVVMLTILLAGCAGAIPRDAHLVHGAVTVTLEGGGDVDMGHHCDGSSWSEDPPRAHLFPYDGAPPRILLLRNVTTDGGGIGQGRVHDAGTSASGTLPIRSLVARGASLGNLSWTEDEVRLDGSLLEIGATRTLTIEHDGPFGRANETLVLRYWGVGLVTTEDTPPGFACM